MRRWARLLCALIFLLLTLGFIETASAADTTAPTLYVSTLPTGSITKDRTLNVSGTVYDSESGVASVTVNGQAATINPDGTFSAAVSLVDGLQEILTVATDNATNASWDSRNITFSASASELWVDQPADNSVTNSSSVTLSGTYGLSAQLCHVYVNGGSDIVYTIGETYPTFSGSVTLQTGINNILVQVGAMHCPSYSLTSAVRTVTLDTTNPSLAITDPWQDMTTDASSVAIHGTVGGSSPSVTMSINGGSPTSVTVSGGAFDTTVSLPSTGYYKIIFTATDSGNTSTVTRNIIRGSSTTLTTADPSGGILNGETVSLQCSQLGAYSCASTKYCIGSSGCTLWRDFTDYNSPLSISSSTDLNFYSIDSAGDIESIKTANYTVILGESTSQGTVSCTGNVCTVTPATGYYLITLTDNGNDVTSQMVSNQYTITNTSIDHTLSATYAEYPVNIFGTSNYYLTLQDALNAATDGQQVRLLGSNIFTEDINFNSSGVAVILSGGYASNFSTRSATDATTIIGSITVTQGTLTADQLVIQ